MMASSSTIRILALVMIDFQGGPDSWAEDDIDLRIAVNSKTTQDNSARRLAVVPVVKKLGRIPSISTPHGTTTTHAENPETLCAAVVDCPHLSHDLYHELNRLIAIPGTEVPCCIPMAAVRAAVRPVPSRMIGSIRLLHQFHEGTSRGPGVSSDC